MVILDLIVSGPGHGSYVVHFAMLDTFVGSPQAENCTVHYLNILENLSGNSALEKKALEPE